MEGRVMIQPYGWYDERAREQGEVRVQRYTPFSPRDIYGNVYLLTSYSDPNKETTIYAYVNMLRRIRKLSSSDKQDQAVGQDICFDDAEGFAQALSPMYYPYEYKVVEDREYLMPGYSTDGASYLDSKENFKW